MFGFLNTKERNSILPNSFKNEYYGEICFSVDIQYLFLSPF